MQGGLGIRLQALPHFWRCRHLKKAGYYERQAFGDNVLCCSRDHVGHEFLPLPTTAELSDQKSPEISHFGREAIRLDEIIPRPDACDLGHNGFVKST